MADTTNRTRDAVSQRIIFSIMIALAISLCIGGMAHAATSSQFNVTITITPSNYTPPYPGGMEVNLIAPDNRLYNVSSLISFRTVVSYNRSAELWCDLKIDGNIVRNSYIADGTEKIWVVPLSLTHGQHSWNMNCSDSSLKSAEGSATKSFTVDLDPPVITLLKENPALSLIDTININFTASDTISPTATCRLDGSSYSGTPIAYGPATFNSNLVMNFTLTGLPNHDYNYNITCWDNVNNRVTSVNQKFMINTQANFTIKTNKDVYTLGESGIYIIEGPQGAAVTVVITSPKATTVIRSYSGQFPFLDNLDFAQHEGTYTIEGYLVYNGAYKTFTKTFEVKNTLETEIRADKSRILKGETIAFGQTTSGGLGAITYTWDYGDGTPLGTGESPSHTYTKNGDYTVTLTVKDSKQNTRTDTLVVRVVDQYVVDVIVLEDASNSIMTGVAVRLNSDSRSTDAFGRATYLVMPGEYQLVVNSAGYEVETRNFNLTGSLTMGIRLKRIDYSKVPINESNDNEDNEDNEDNSDNNQNQNDQQDNNDEEDPFADDTLIVNGELNEYVMYVESALQQVKAYTGDMRAIAEKLNMQFNLEKAQQYLTMANRDLSVLNENRKGLHQDEITTRKNELYVNINKTINGVISDIVIYDNKEFVTFPSDKEVSQIARDYLNSTKAKYDTKKTDYYGRYTQAIQSEISYKVYMAPGRMEYLSGSGKEMTLFVIEISSDESLAEKSLVVSIPKSIAQSAANVNSLSEGTVIKDDPMLVYPLDENRKVVFMVDGIISTEDARELKAVLVHNPARVDFQAKGFGITGSAIFSAIDDIENPVVIIEVLVIAILLIVFVLYQFDLIDKIKEYWTMRDKALAKPKTLLEELDKQIASREVDNCYIVLADIEKLVAELPLAQKKKITRSVIEAKNKVYLLDIDSQISLGLAKIAEGQPVRAQENYTKCMDLYKLLPNEMRASVIERAKGLYEKIFAALSQPVAQSAAQQPSQNPQPQQSAPTQPATTQQPSAAPTTVVATPVTQAATQPQNQGGTQ